MNQSTRTLSITCSALLGFGVACTAVNAAIVPFTEDFTADNANWKNYASADLGFIPAGGPDASSYATAPVSFETNASGDGPVLLRGQSNFDASADAFVGNWLAQGVTEFSVYVRHGAPTPLVFFTRFASELNFPGAVAVNFAPVLPNTWTKITFDISVVSPQFVSFEGSDFNLVFGNIGNVQVGVTVPASLAGSTTLFNLDIDQPTITPEPASLGLMSAGALLCLLRRRSFK